MLKKPLWGISKKALLKKIANLEKNNDYLRKDNIRLHELCELKDAHFMEMISDGLRHRSSLAAKYMADRKNHINGR